MKVELSIRTEVADAFNHGRPVVALESTLITHGLPWPDNVVTAREAEAVIRGEGATPATIAILDGSPQIGLSDKEIEELSSNSRGAAKASRRDLAAMIAQKKTAATTVAATMFLAHKAGISIMATGGIGGVHRDAERTFDISADLIELAKTPICVVCAGAKSILDIPRTLEFLETHGVPIVGYQTEYFPAFYVRSSSGQLDTWAETPDEVARLLSVHWQVGTGGVLLTQPCPMEHALEPSELESALHEAALQAQIREVKGKQVTPFLLAKLAEVTQGKTLKANRALVVANARLAAKVANALHPYHVGR